MEHKDIYRDQSNKFRKFAFLLLPENKHGSPVKFLKILIPALFFFFLLQNSSMAEKDFRCQPGGTVMKVLPPPLLMYPDLRCVAVNPSGDVTLTWIPPSDTATDFDSYHLYYATNAAGPYTEIDSIFNYYTVSYTHVGANADIQPVFYYMKTRSNSSGMIYSSPSDTLETIFLNVVNSGMGAADLSWNPIHTPDLPSSMGWYHIYREYPAGTWVLIDSTQQYQYSDPITLCYAQINYFVDIDDACPCTSISSIDGDLFQDQTEPVSPLIDSVSVDSLTSHTVIGWAASPSGDTEGYIIYENKNGIWIPIDTVWGLNNTFYENSMTYWSNPDSSSLWYQVAAFDSCMNTSPISSNQNSIFLTSVLDVCGGSVTLNWTPYVNMMNGLEGYKIYVKENNGPLTLLATNDASTLTFSYSPLTQFSTYIFSVQAFDSTGVVTSTSNNDTVYVYVPGQPQFVYLRYVTVRNNASVELKAIVDTSGFISDCKIMRADDTSSVFSNIGNVSVSPMSNTIVYNDATAEVNEMSYQYKVILIDSCGNEVLESNPGQTIFLAAEPGSDMVNDLGWNEYAEWLGDVSAYNVYRAVDNAWDPNPIIMLSPSNTTYNDDASPFLSSNGTFEYFVQATEGPGNPYFFADTSISNIVEVMQPPRFYIPNAFVPGGLNNVFVPYTVFVDAQDYQLSIYNRSGQIVFLTNDINTAWDGTFQGEPAPQGVYVYAIQYKNSMGVFIEKHGTVTMLR
jgi:gliding motility-associated-like protein